MKNIFIIVFIFNTQVETWYSNFFFKLVQSTALDESGDIYSIHCVLSIGKESTEAVLFASLMLCYTERSSRTSP